MYEPALAAIFTQVDAVFRVTVRPILALVAEEILVKTVAAELGEVGRGEALAEVGAPFVWACALYRRVVVDYLVRDVKAKDVQQVVDDPDVAVTDEADVEAEEEVWFVGDEGDGEVVLP